MTPTLQTVAAASIRRSLLSKTALCGALCGLGALSPQAARALPIGGVAQVGGGGAPVISTGTDRVDVTLNAPRTVISWGSYDLAPNETATYNFGSRDWIVLNRISGLQISRIEGTLQGKVGSDFGGNIWFVANNSIVFGETARVDTGGLLAVVGSADITSFLDPSNTLFSFSGGDVLPDSKVMVLSGGQVNGHGGFVALAGPKIVTRYNATVTASDGGDVLYGAAKTFQIRLAPGAAGDFDLVDFIVADSSGATDARVAADLAGETKANSVFVAAVSRAALGSAVINVEGLITAQAAKADGGDIVLSGGGGIANRLPAPPPPGATGGDLYLNKASASRDLLIQNAGRIFARPWARPASEALDPPAINDECQDINGCDSVDNGFGNGNGNGNGNGFGMDVVENVELLASLFDPTAISTINVAGDARINATSSIELGRIIASGDVSVEGPSIKANALIASGALTATASDGEVAISGIGAMGSGVVSATTDAKIDTITAPQTLAVSAGRDIILGDGTSDVSGLVTLTAARDVRVNLASGKMDGVVAGGLASLSGGALDIGSVTASRLLAQAQSVKIGTATSATDVYVFSTSGAASVGTANAGDDVYIGATHGAASLGVANLTGQGADSVSQTFSGNTDAAGNGRVVSVRSSDLDALLGLGTGGVSGATTVSVTAGQDAFVEVLQQTSGVLSVVAARDATLKAPSVSIDAVTAGRDLTVGSTVGDFTLTGALSSTRNITITAAGALKVGDVRADSGSVTLTGASVAAGAVSASEDLILQATSGGVSTTSYAVGRDLIIQGSTLSLGSSIGPVNRDLSITSSGNFTSTTPLSAGRDLTLDVAGKAVIGQATAAGNLRVVAGDLDLTGAVTAATAQIESKTGGLRVGGATGSGGGLILDNAEFGQLHVAGQLRLYAGSTTDSARGALVLQDLTINPGSTPDVAFLVGSAFDAQVQGVVTPVTGGGVLRIGDATDLSWRPGSILVTGALGSATFSGGDYSNIKAFDDLRLAARNDILMGSQRFITLIQGTDVRDIDISSGLPSGVAPVAGEQFKIFAATGHLEVSAENKVVQQNTAPSGSAQAVGLYLSGAATPALTIDPPKILELYGAFSGANGQTVSGPGAASVLTFTVVDASGTPTNKPADAEYRFNSCDVGTSNCIGLSAGGSSATADQNASLLTIRDQLSDATMDGSQTSEEAGEAAVSSESLTKPPNLLGIAPADSDEIVVDPVITGAGSEEIWRKRRQNP